MTTAEWLRLFSPIIAVLVGVVASILSLALSGLTSRLKEWLEAHGHAAASQIVTDANERMQAAMQNSAGMIALKIQTGEISATDMGSICAEVAKQAGYIAQKLPDAINTLKPSPGAITGGIMGKITGAMPAQTAASQPATTKGNETPNWNEATSFSAKAAIVKARLMADFGLKDFQAAAVVGNLGAESRLEAINEVRPVAGRGGFGWAQWTGPRRVALETWCKDKGLSLLDPEANYQFLVYELRGPERSALEALLATSNLEEATQCFEAKYERAGVVAMERRISLAHQAMLA